MSKSSLSRRHASRGTAALLAGFVATGGVLAGCGGNDKEKSTANPTTTKQAGVQTQQLPTQPNAPGATKTGGGKAALASLPPTSRSGAQPRIKGVEGQPLAKQLSILDNDIANFWLGQFNKAKIKFQTVTTRFAPAGGAISTACGDLSGDDISYCPKDSSINLLQSFFEKHAAPIGDFAVALPVAYLWGQAVEHQLGVDAKVSDKQGTLIAQCLAGSWAASVYQRGALEPGDLQEGAKLIASIAPSQQANQDLVNAFNTGYNGGKSGSCGKVGG